VSKQIEKLIADAKELSAKWQGKEMPEAEILRYNEIMKEGAELSEKQNQEIANQKTLARMEAAAAFGREVPNTSLPAAEQKNESKVAGYITPGQFVAFSEAFQKWNRNGNGFRSGTGVGLDMKGSFFPKNGASLIALTESEVKAYNNVVASLETKDMPVLGTDVIAPNRTNRFVQDEKPQVLTFRDVITVLPTSSPLIQYVAEVSFTNAADIQSEGSTAATMELKPDADIEYELRDATVRTIAHTMPVSEQQLADAPALISRINQRLLHGVHLKEEQLCAYGTGTGLEFAGVFDSDSDIAAATTISGSPTLIDKIRAAYTDVFSSGYNPSFVWIHPLDWETIELTKGSDGHYVWAIIHDVLGARIWSMRVVQGIGTKKAGAADRNVLVGDGTGAVLYDREQANLAVGFVDDDFARNLRTIRAEERVVLCVEAPAAFRKINTAS